MIYKAFENEEIEFIEKIITTKIQNMRKMNDSENHDNRLIN